LGVFAKIMGIETDYRPKTQDPSRKTNGKVEPRIGTVILPRRHEEDLLRPLFNLIYAGLIRNRH
jgi:hypothetical protein